MFRNRPRLNIFTYEEEDTFRRHEPRSYPNFTSEEYSSPPGTKPSMDMFIRKVEKVISDTDPRYVLFKHRYREELEDMVTHQIARRTRVKYITFRPGKVYKNGVNTFAAFIDNILDERIKEMFDDNYETYTKCKILGEEVDTDVFICLHENPGGASDDVTRTVYSYTLGITEYLLETAPGPTNACFYNILKTVCDEDDIDSLINHLGGSMLKPKDLRILHPYLIELGVQIQVTYDGDVMTYGEGIIIKVMYHDAHWAIIRDQTVASETEEPRSHRFFTYDFETVNDQPYMFSTWDPQNKSRVIYTESPGTEDFNTEVYSILSDYEAKGYTAVGFNSNNYDDLYLVRILDLKRARVIKGNGNSIIKLTYKTMEFVDACRFLKCSLSEACRMLAIKNPKLHQDHDALTKEYLLTGVLNVTLDMIRYSARDTESLWHVWHKTKKMFKDTFKLNPDVCISLSQMVYNKFKQVNHGVPQLADIKWRQHIIGGKCHGVKGIHVGKVNVYDVNSLYPFVMMTRTFISRGSNWKSTPKVVWHGLYHVRVTSNPKYCIIPKRGEVLDWAPIGEYESWCSGIDIEEHVKYGGSLEVLEGWCYSDAEFSDSMFDFLNEYHEIKQTSTGPMRALAKLLMNSLSGKLTQTPIENETVMSDNGPIVGSDSVYLNNLLWMNTHPKATPTTTGSLINGILVYSYARQHLHRYMYQCDDCLYCDTDSIFTTSELECGDELGEMKYEGSGDMFVVGGKKMYTLTLNGEIVKTALKGARLEGIYGDDTEVTSSDTWLLRAIEEGKTEFSTWMTQCDRREMDPIFKTVPKKFKVGL